MSRYAAFFAALLVAAAPLPSEAGLGSEPYPYCKPCDGGPGGKSTFSVDTNVMRNSIVTLPAPNGGRGPHVSIQLTHDPAMDWDADYDGTTGPDLKHEYKFDLMVDDDTEPDCNLLRGWDLRVDWDRDGSFNDVEPDEIISDESGQSYDLTDHFLIYNKIEQNGDLSRGDLGSFDSSLTIAKTLPPELSPSSQAAYAYRLSVDFAYQEGCEATHTSDNNYGYLYIPTLSNFESVFGKNWRSNWDRHLEFYPDGIAYTGTNAEVMMWIDADGWARGFEYPAGDPETGVEYQPIRLADSSPYVFVYNTLQDFDPKVGDEEYWELHHYGPGDREYYYPADHATLPGKLCAVKDQFGNTVVLAYEKSSPYRLKKITDAVLAEWIFTYTGSTTIDIDFNKPGQSSSRTARFHKDAHGRLDYWIAPEHQPSTYTQDFTYGETDTFERNRILTKTGAARPQVDYTYDTTAESLSEGYLRETQLNEVSELTWNYDYDWAQTIDLPDDTKSQKRIIVKSPEDTGGRPGTKLYVMGNGCVWREESTNDSDDNLLIKEYRYLINEDNNTGFHGIAKVVLKKKVGGNETELQTDYTTYVPWETDDAKGKAGKIHFVETKGDPNHRRDEYLYLSTDCPTSCNSDCADEDGHDVYAPVHLTRHAHPTSEHEELYIYDDTTPVCSGDALVPVYMEVPLSAITQVQTHYDYNNYGQITTLTPPEPGYYTYTYYSGSTGGAYQGMLEKLMDPETTDEAEGNTTEYEYDTNGNVAAVATLDEPGATKRRTEYVYDAGGNLTRVVEKGSPNDIETEYLYDHAGRLTSTLEKDNSNRRNEYLYNTLGQLTREQRCDPSEGCHTYYDYTYDYEGRVKSRTDANDVTLYTKYDARGQVTRVRNWDSGSCTDPCWEETYEYTVNSLLKHVSWDYDIDDADLDYANDIYYWYDYDDTDISERVGRLLATATRVVPDSDDWRHLVYTYASSGCNRITHKRICTANDPAYLGETCDAEPFELHYDVYDYRDRLSRLRHKSSSWDDVYITYTDRGNLDIVCEDANCDPGYKTDYDYYKNDWLKKITHSGYANLPTYEFGEAGVLTQGYDNDGNRMQIKESYGIGFSLTNDHSYDDFNRLTDFDTDGTEDESLDYSYDAIGNITRKVGSATTTYSYDELERLEQTQRGMLGTFYCHDDNGNMTYRGTTSVTCSSLGANQRFWWDFGNRLVKHDGTAGGAHAKLAYDPFGRRVMEVPSDDGVGYLYLWDGDQPIARYRYDQDGDPDEYYVYGEGIDQLFAKWVITEEDPERYDYLTDGIGSVVRVLNDSSIEGAFRYEPYGKMAESADTPIDRFTFTSRETDALEGGTTMYYRARWYDPEIGRFMSRDRWPGLREVPQSLNAYPYVIGNPIRYNDPSGYKWSSGKEWDPRIWPCWRLKQRCGEHVEECSPSVCGKCETFESVSGCVDTLYRRTRSCCYREAFFCRTLVDRGQALLEGSARWNHSVGRIRGCETLPAEGCGGPGTGGGPGGGGPPPGPDPPTHGPNYPRM